MYSLLCINLMLTIVSALLTNASNTYDRNRNEIETEFKCKDLECIRIELKFEINGTKCTLELVQHKEPEIRRYKVATDDRINGCRYYKAMNKEQDGVRFCSNSQLDGILTVNSTKFDIQFDSDRQVHYLTNTKPTSNLIRNVRQAATAVVDIIVFTDVELFTAFPATSNKSQFEADISMLIRVKLASYFAPLNIIIQPLIIEHWYTGDGNPDVTDMQFLQSVKQRYYATYNHDLAILLSGKPSPIEDGTYHGYISTSTGLICTDAGNSAAVLHLMQGTQRLPENDVLGMLMHVIGHEIGFREIPAMSSRCSCAMPGNCVMTGLRGSNLLFDSCSLALLDNLPGLTCLYPVSSVTPVTPATMTTSVDPDDKTSKQESSSKVLIYVVVGIVLVIVLGALVICAFSKRAQIKELPEDLDTAVSNVKTIDSTTVN